MLIDLYQAGFGILRIQNMRNHNLLSISTIRTKDKTYWASLDIIHFFCIKYNLLRNI